MVLADRHTKCFICKICRNTEEEPAIRICFVGNRLAELACRNSESHPVCIGIKEKLRMLILNEMRSDDMEHVFITGMEAGPSMWMAEEVLKIKQDWFCNIKLICAEPFKMHINFMVNNSWRKRYSDVLSAADEVHTLMHGYTTDTFAARDGWMLEHSDEVFAVLNNIHDYSETAVKNNTPIASCFLKRNKTYATVLNAMKQGKRVFAIDPLALENIIEIN